MHYEAMCITNSLDDCNVWKFSLTLILLMSLQHFEQWALNVHSFLIYPCKTWDPKYFIENSRTSFLDIATDWFLYRKSKLGLLACNQHLKLRCFCLFPYCHIWSVLMVTSHEHAGHWWISILDGRLDNAPWHYESALGCNGRRTCLWGQLVQCS